MKSNPIRPEPFTACFRLVDTGEGPLALPSPRCRDMRVENAFNRAGIRFSALATPPGSTPADSPLLDHGEAARAAFQRIRRRASVIGRLSPSLARRSWRRCGRHRRGRGWQWRVGIRDRVAVRIWIGIVAAAVIEATAEQDRKQQPYVSHQARMSLDAAIVQVTLRTGLRDFPYPRTRTAASRRRLHLRLHLPVRGAATQGTWGPSSASSTCEGGQHGGSLIRESSELIGLCRLDSSY
jgi:hypothetical protein